MIVENYTVENGLPHNSVYCTLKDIDGFMWLGTWYGLSSFDGLKFYSYNSRNDFNTDIPPHKIQNIIEAKDNNLWVKTIDHKLYLFDKKNERFYDVFNEIKKKYSVSPKIIKIQRSETGDILLLTKNKDLLLAASTGNGSMKVTLLYDSQVKREHKLTNNLFIEDDANLNWIGMDFKIISRLKGKILKSKPTDFIRQKITQESGIEFSCAFQTGNFFWLGTTQGVFYKIDLSNGNIVKNLYFKGKGAIQNIIGVSGKNFYISVGKTGVFELDERTGDIKSVFPLTSNEQITNSYIDSYDKLWLEVNLTSLIYFDPFNKIVKHLNFESGKVNKNLILQDGNELGMFILNTSGDVFQFDRMSGELVQLNNQAELNNNGEKKFFYGMTLDKDNILWLMSTINGIFRISFPKQQFSLLHPETKTLVGETAIKSMFQSRNGDIWIGTRTSEVFQLNRDGQLKQVFKGKNAIGNVYHFMEDYRGNLWFSTKGNGLIKAEPDPKSSTGYRLTSFKSDETKPDAIIGNDVYFTFEDSNHRIWIGSFGGGLNLIENENGRIVFKNKFNSFSNYPKFGLYMEVRNITEDKNGRIWVGTSDGLMSFDSNFKNPDKIEFEIYRNEKLSSNIADNDIYVLYKDAESQIWMSVFGGGLNKLVRYDDKQKLPVFKSYTLSQGLSSDVILSIVEDNNNNLWFATENGLSFFDKKKEVFRNFDRYDGFLNVQMEEESALKVNTGDLWFGSRKGILAFNPEKIETYNCEYNTFIVNFLVSNKNIREFNQASMLKESIQYAKSITLKHNQSNFVIEFAALNYYNQNRVSYKYILEGYEDEWHFNGKNRIASYPNVPHGDYTFRVQTIDEANALLKSERTLGIIILPPWWLTWWSKIIYFIIIVLLSYGIIKAILFYIKMRNEVYIEQRVSELKIRFFTNISHELRTPLTLITGPIQELKQKQQLNEKGMQYIALIEKSANQMLQLVNQILDFRKIQNGKMILHVSQLDLNKLVAGFQKEFAVMSEENEISFSFQFTDEEIPVWADKEKIETVVRNVISNAFKFTKKGGSIFISTHQSEDKQHCIIRIEDTGIGIPQNKITDIFERFTQIDNSKNQYYKGTGIGLALSKEIITLHHGNISAEGKPGVGSVFTIELLTGKDHFNPNEVNFYVGDMVEENQISDESNVEPVNELIENNNLPLLLVVEDNKDLCNLLKMQLEDRYNVLIANNGLEGLKKVNHYHPDIVVTDQMMPEMTGTDMLQKIRNDFRVSHIPVIILTAKSDEDAKLNAINLGANAYITKPFNKEYLIARIEQLLSDRKVFREKIWNQEEITDAATEQTENFEKYLVKKDILLLEKINQEIEKNIANCDYNIDALAENMGLSRSAFFKKLKSLTGLAPVDLIKEIRLNKSVEMIKNTDLTISEIAFAVGFKEAGYYGKCFRKKYETTPTEFISKYRKI